MRRMILLSVVVLLAVSGAVSGAEAQRRGGMVMASSGGHFGTGRIASSGAGNHASNNAGNYASHEARGMRYGLGYGYGYGGGVPYDEGGISAYPPQPMAPAEPPAAIVEPPPPEVHPVVTSYTWPAAGASAPAGGATWPAADAAARAGVAAAAAESTGGSQSFGIVLRDGRTISAVTVTASGAALQCVDTDERHLRIAMSEVDRTATLKLNRERKLTLYLPATQ